MKEALPMATIQRAGSFDIVPINDSVQSTTDSAIFCDQDDMIVAVTTVRNPVP
jgi:hypothetical protein